MADEAKQAQEDKVKEVASEVKQAQEDEKKSTKKEVAYFKSKISALKIYVKQPKDQLDPAGAGAEVVRFKPFYDTWKGDTIRVGFLEVEGKDAIKAVDADPNTEKIDKKDFDKAMEELRPAPIKVA